MQLLSKSYLGLKDWGAFFLNLSTTVKEIISTKESMSMLETHHRGVYGIYLQTSP